jgi:hypothetical protein
MASVDTAVAEVNRIAKKGVRGGLIPADPGEGLFWNDPRFEPIWKAYRGRTGPVHLPDELHGKVEGVFGLDDRQQARPHFRSWLP